MDDFNVSSLHESKNEWGARLLTIMTPLIIDGFKSIFDESLKMCKETDEMEKYLMTFQNLITRIPKWNAIIIEKERKRIIERSGCSYLEELITCVHIIQLKLLTAMRVGQKQKKIDINIPKFDDFIHKAYINVARKVYMNVYLFEHNITPLQIQKHNRELETIVQECILNTVRESIPIENILRAYMDETVEEEMVEEIKEQEIEIPPEEIESQVITEESPITKNDIKLDGVEKSNLKFNDMDSVHSESSTEMVSAPKTIERLEEISEMRNIQRKLEEQDDDDDDKPLVISSEDISLGSLDVHNMDPPSIKLDNDFLLDNIEILA